MHAEIRLHLFPANDTLKTRWLVGASSRDPKAEAYPSYAKALQAAEEWLESRGGGTIVAYDIHLLEASRTTVADRRETGPKEEAAGSSRHPQIRPRPSSLAERL
jgi:hypothetical protein